MFLFELAPDQIADVSSHALDQRRADCVEFDAAAFTNLTQDHLDYHQTMEACGAAKARLHSDRAVVQMTVETLNL